MQLKLEYYGLINLPARLLFSTNTPSRTRHRPKTRLSYAYSALTKHSPIWRISWKVL
jgi:hypothetical protein